MEQIFYSISRTPWTPLLLASRTKGLAAIHFLTRTGADEVRQTLGTLFAGDELIESPKTNRLVEEEIEAYSAGELRRFTVPLDLRGTDFQISVWQALREIPYGETRSYAEIARAIGRPKSFRAVGLANGSNPIPIVVPCHRVIGSNGSLVGYGGGIALKRALLEHERLHSPSHPSARITSSLPLW